MNVYHVELDLPFADDGEDITCDVAFYRTGDKITIRSVTGEDNQEYVDDLISWSTLYEEVRSICNDTLDDYLQEGV